MRNTGVDIWRGISIIAMVIYHLLWDLQFLFGINFNLESRLWTLIARVILINFLCLVGISWQLKSFRLPKNPWTFRTHAMPFIKRGLTIFGGGMVISLITYIFDASTYVRFGVLHLIGIATM